jgi:antitoxin YefM
MYTIATNFTKTFKNGSYIITNFRQQLKSYLDKVRNDHEPLVVTGANAEDVVVISKTDYESMEETFYLLKSPANAARLLKGIQDYENGLGQERKLIKG